MSIKEEKILVIGISGQVASAMQDALSTHSHTVFCGRTLEGAKYEGRLRYRVLDLAQISEIGSILKDESPSIIINTAAYTAVDKAEEDQEKARLINTLVVKKIGEIASELYAIVVHYSTDYVYSGEGESSWVETDPADPINYYGITKLEGERALQQSCKKHLIFRTAWVFSDIGSNFVKSILKLGTEREVLQVVDDQFGSPTSAREIAQVTLEVLSQLLAKRGSIDKYFGIYNLVCEGSTNRYEFALKIISLATDIGFDIKVERFVPVNSKAFPTAAKRPSNSRLNCARLSSNFNIESTTWEDELAYVLNRIKNATNDQHPS